MQPSSKKDAQDPSNAYERSHPENEAGMGDLDANPDATPTDCPDSIPQTVTHRQKSRQLNAGDAVNRRGHATGETNTG